MAGTATGMLAGVEDVDWASLSHAYGDASDVPELLRGLASADPAERDIALDGLYGAVHHQGDVYDSTVACVPFLFALAGDAAVEDRGAIVGLLRSIAGEEEPDPDEIGGLFEDEDEDAAWVANFVTAAALVRGRADFFLERLADPDPQLRAAVPGALAQLHSDPARAFAALRSRVPVEGHGSVVRSLAEAIGALGVAHEELRPEAGRCLADVLASAGADPAVCLTALTQLARCAPQLLPADSVESAVDAMRRAHEAGPGATDGHQERPRTDTMVSYLRELKAAHQPGIDAGLAHDLLRELHLALDDRTEERFGLLHAQLRTPDRGQRLAAVQEAGRLLTGWRAPNDLAVALLARQLAEHDEDLSRAALSELAYVHPIAGVTADVLAACLVEWEDDWDPADWQRSLFGGALKALALQGDARAVPCLAAVLDGGGGVPERLDRWVKAMGPRARARLAPALHDRLARMGSRAGGAVRARLTDALGVCAPAASLPLITTALYGDHYGTALGALARYGPAAADTAPRLRELARDTSSADQHGRLSAAEALWAVSGDATHVLPVLRDALAGDRWYARERALLIAAALGPDAAPLAPRVRALTTGTEGCPAQAAITLWHIRRDAAEVLPVLLDQWTTTPGSRPAAAACLVSMGRAAAPALPLIRRELTSARRHDNTGTRSNMRYDVAADEDLLDSCRRLTAALG
ncbi:HEAT repeat domain-containing protein [Streptomyces sp. NPDC015345]|uniref:HEAT repeat domain-containing protein n=1 Tax=Streptomyces sp. NPDC015345 TaxID=3364953 RepID=UPI0037025AA5